MQTVYDSMDTPIMLILDEDDVKNIQSMAPGASKYCSYPSHMDPQGIKLWMDAYQEKVSEVVIV